MPYFWHVPFYRISTEVDDGAMAHTTGAAQWWMTVPYVWQCPYFRTITDVDDSAIRMPRPLKKDQKRCGSRCHTYVMAPTTGAAQRWMTVPYAWQGPYFRSSTEVDDGAIRLVRALLQEQHRGA